MCRTQAERELWTPQVDVRMAERDVGDALGSVTFEFRVFSMYETVSGPRGLWWDELVRLFAERLDFAVEFSNWNWGRGLQIDVDPAFLSGQFLWAPVE